MCSLPYPSGYGYSRQGNLLRISLGWYQALIEPFFYRTYQLLRPESKTFVIRLR